MGKASHEGQNKQSELNKVDFPRFAALLIRIGRHRGRIPLSNLVSIPVTHTEPSHGCFKWFLCDCQTDSTGLQAQPCMLAPCSSHTCRPTTLRTGLLFTTPDPTRAHCGGPIPTLPLSTSCQWYLLQVTSTLHLQTLVWSQLPEWPLPFIIPDPETLFSILPTDATVSCPCTRTQHMN